MLIVLKEIFLINLGRANKKISGKIKTFVSAQATDNREKSVKRKRCFKFVVCKYFNKKNIETFIKNGDPILFPSPYRPCIIMNKDQAIHRYGKNIGTK